MGIGSVITSDKTNTVRLLPRWEVCFIRAEILCTLPGHVLVYSETSHYILVSSGTSYWCWILCTIPSGAGILLCTIPNFELGYYVPSQGMHWYILAKIRVWPRIWAIFEGLKYIGSQARACDAVPNLGLNFPACQNLGYSYLITVTTCRP
jgi:hypothetical protein